MQANFEKIPLIPIQQNGTTYYMAVMDISKYGKLMTVSPMEYKLNIFSGELLEDEKDEIMNLLRRKTDPTGYQRFKSNTRVRSIADYLKKHDGFNHFIPNAILIAAKANPISADALNGKLEGDVFIQESPDIALYIRKELFTLGDDNERKNKFFIIDGNHRVQGILRYSAEKEKPEPFEMPVSILLNKDQKIEAEIFKTVNYEAKPVNRSYLYQILGEFELGSEEHQYMHKLAEILNSWSESPFKARIKMIGSSMPGGKQSFSQAFFIEQVYEWLMEVKPRLSIPITAGIIKIPVLRYIYDNNEVACAKLLISYFVAVRNCFKRSFDKDFGEDSWNTLFDNYTKGQSPQNYLLKPIGVGAFIELFPVIFMKMLFDRQMINKQDLIFDEDIKESLFTKYLEPIIQKDILQHIDTNYSSASSQGLVRKLANDLFVNRFEKAFDDVFIAEKEYVNWFKQQYYTK